MSDTTKYELEEVAYSVAGWNGILTTNMQKLDNFLHTRILATLGETFATYEAGYVESDGKWWKAQDGVSGPCLGLAVEPADADEQIRFQRVGPMTNVAWAWTPGGKVYLSDATPGALTQTPTLQVIGIALSATSVFLNVQIPG